MTLAGSTGLQGTTIAFDGTVDGPRNLALTATGGPINFAAAVGGTTPLGSLVINRATSTTAAGRVVLNGTATGAYRTGLLIAAGVNNVTMTQTGNSVTGFQGNGVVLQGGSRASVFANFALAANGESGFLVQAGDTTGTVIRDNAITGNGFNGIWLSGATPSVSILGNTLTGNNNNGIVVSGPATGVLINGNTVTGSGLTGIRTEVVAGLAPSAMTISGNTVRNNQENGIILAGNSGTTVTSNVVTENRLQGITLTLGATQTTIDSNQIYKNGAFGVVVSGASTLGNSILSNSMYLNVNGGIALLDGGNRGQVRPTLTSAQIANGRLAIAGSITGQAGDVFRIQYFSSRVTDAATNAKVEGRTLIGFRDVQLTGTSASINASFSSLGVPSKGWVSATATRLTNGTPGNTSEFALGVRVTGG